MSQSDRSLALQLAHGEMLQHQAMGYHPPVDAIELAKKYEAFLDGSADRQSSYNHSIEIAARAAHEAIRALQIAHNEEGIALPWNEVAKDIRDSCKIGVQRVMDNPDVTSEELHASWIETKLSQGYKYGPVRNDELKEHHCLVPYDQLSPHDRSKDLIFRNVVKAVLGL